MRAFFLLSLVGLVGLFGCNAPAEGGSRGIAIGDLAPEIATTDIHGNVFDLDALKGSYVLIDFWGSWCGPCIKEAPEIVAIHNNFGPKGLKVVSVAIEKTDKNWKKASNKLGYSWEHQLVEVSQFVRFNKIASAYEVTDIPSVFLLDKEGRVILSRSNGKEASAKLKELL